jgi:hypothetical protein
VALIVTAALLPRPPPQLAQVQALLEALVIGAVCTVPIGENEI